MLYRNQRDQMCMQAYEKSILDQGFAADQGQVEFLA